MRKLLRRLANRIAGPNGWLIGDDPDDHELAQHRANGDRIPYLPRPIKPPKESKP
jgi:hypothetical protein